MSAVYVEYFGELVEGLRCEWCHRLFLQPATGPRAPRTCGRRCSKTLSRTRAWTRRGARR